MGILDWKIACKSAWSHLVICIHLITVTNSLSCIFPKSKYFRNLKTKDGVGKSNVMEHESGTRSHNMTLINKTKFLTDADFLIRMLYKYSY